jgi:hypothetical protein
MFSKPTYKILFPDFYSVVTMFALFTQHCMMLRMHRAQLYKIVRKYFTATHVQHIQIFL